VLSSSSSKETLDSRGEQKGSCIGLSFPLC
jgi:hypothetical protein